MVTVVHAYKPPRNVSDPLGLARRRADRRDQAQAVLDELLLIGDDELLETEYETELVEGEAASAIDAVARRVDADEIVVGARGRGRLPGLLGSVSHQLLAIADRPVLVVPARAVKSRPRRQPVGAPGVAPRAGAGSRRAPGPDPTGQALAATGTRTRWARSTRRLEYPHSLSYQQTTLTWVPSTTVVSPESKIDE